MPDDLNAEPAMPAAPAPPTSPPANPAAGQAAGPADPGMRQLAELLTRLQRLEQTAGLGGVEQGVGMDALYHNQRDTGEFLDDLHQRLRALEMALTEPPDHDDGVMDVPLDECLGGGMPVQWQFSKYSSLSMKVGHGIWTRHLARLEWNSSGAAAAIDVPGVAGTYYLYATITRAGTPEYHPGLYPDGIAVLCSARNVNPGADSTQNTVVTLGKVVVAGGVIASFRQWVFSDLDNCTHVPDGDNKGGIESSGESPLRKTIERNPHTSENSYLSDQLHDVDTCKAASKSVPFFQDTRTAGDADNAEGQLEWSMPDTNHPGRSPNLQKSIEIRTAAPNDEKDLQLYGFNLPTQLSALLADQDMILIRRVDSGVTHLQYMPVSTQDVLVSLRHEVGGAYIQGKTRKAVCYGEESAWTNLILTAPCPTS